MNAIISASSSSPVSASSSDDVRARIADSITNDQASRTSSCSDDVIVSRDRDADSRLSALDDRRVAALHEMQERMEKRQRDWDSQVGRLKRDFFQQPMWSTPSGGLVPSDQMRKIDETTVMHRQQQQSSSVGLNNANRLIDVRPSAISSPLFLATFEMSQYQPSEITVRTDGQRHLIVEGRHQEQGMNGRSTFSRQFNRQIDIPRHIDSTQLRCTFTNGLLKVELDPSLASSSESTTLPLTAAEAHSNKLVVNSHTPAAATASLSASALSAGNSESRMKAGGGHGSKGHPFIRDSHGNKRFLISVDIGSEYLPEELTVKTVDRKLYLLARHDESGPGCRTTSREMNREFDLPDSVDPESVTANLTEDGQLVIEAPMIPSSPKCSSISSPLTSSMNTTYNSSNSDNSNQAVNR